MSGVLRAVRFLMAAGLIVGLAACASPYEEGKSPADVPAHIDVVNLKAVSMTPLDPKDLHLAANEFRDKQQQDAALSQNDQEVLSLAKANIVSQLTNFGYKVVEGDEAKSDIWMTYTVHYQPEILLVNRSVLIEGRVYDTTGGPVFRLFQRNRPAVGGLLGVLLEPSRDEMVSTTARDSVVKLVEEVRKGTKENMSVSSLH